MRPDADGVTRSYYATPIERGYLPWALDFTPDDSGAEPFPLRYLINPYQDGKVLAWSTEDWDPALRFWTLPYDRHLTQWLASANAGAPATMAALEIGAVPEKWHPAFMPAGHTLVEQPDLAWQPSNDPKKGFPFIRTELERLMIYMEDDRARYLLESDIQADDIPAYFIHFIGADSVRHPNTLELIRCGLAIGNVVYMAYKAHYKRVRPSTLRPGLTPPFGPPGHPAFPSGHAFLSYFIALLLLEIPALHQRLGVFRAAGNPAPEPEDGNLLDRPKIDDLTGEKEIPSPLLAIARRIAVNRERMGLHYPSDTYAGRHIAAQLWNRTLHHGAVAVADDRIDSPTLRGALMRAKAEWATPWA